MNNLSVALCWESLILKGRATAEGRQFLLAASLQAGEEIRRLHFLAL